MLYNIWMKHIILCNIYKILSEKSIATLDCFAPYLVNLRLWNNGLYVWKQDSYLNNSVIQLRHQTNIIEDNWERNGTCPKTYRLCLR